ncbi:uncharacterized protein LOC129232664 [Uloborus diversus]|uniref:uncharacterized protein LOC129232664 n=1 Tax=Uloborus diversus TaxID=327109 RepID=UPI00240A8F7C|nr:uncharacterized protein LOC129232664 [Uloborus diversus]
MATVIEKVPTVINRQRGILKGRVTRIENFLNTVELEEAEFQLRVKLEALKEILRDLKTLQTEVLGLPDNVDITENLQAFEEIEISIENAEALADDEKSDFPITSDILRNDTYVEDILTGAASVDAAKQSLLSLRNLLKRGGFELHKIMSNSTRIMDDEENAKLSFDFSQPVKTLGMLWRRDTDNFTFAITYEIKDMFTKREVLSTISKLFDPLGLVGPVLTKAKLIMQSLWTLKLNWDESLPKDVMQEWTSFLAQLRQVDQISVKRPVIADNTDAFEIHAFSDASQRAYGVVIYLRCVDTSGNFTTRLLCSKSRICPLKMLTIPRLELCGALLLARLVNKISLILELPISKTFCWTDSSIVLWWINTPVTNLKTYVANRVAEIVTLTGNCSWRWCRKEERSQSLDDLQRARAILVNKVQVRHFGSELAALKNGKEMSTNPVKIASFSVEYELCFPHKTIKRRRK